MIPQIVLTIWLTLAWVIAVRNLGTENMADIATSIVAATIHIAIAVIALHYGGFWTAV